MKRKQHRHNPVARAVRSGKVARPATHKPSKGGAYQRRSKHRPKNSVEPTLNFPDSRAIISQTYACHFSDIRILPFPNPQQMR